jgi:hypothetical protein
MADTTSASLIAMLASPRPQRHEHTHETTIIEKRAPTDESVKLLRKMEKAARRKVDEAVRLSHNGFECICHIERDEASRDLIARAHFMLASERHVVEYRHRYDDFDVSAFGRGVVQAISDRIALRILEPLAAQMGALIPRIR